MEAMCRDSRARRGIGIDAAALPHVFERFSQVSEQDGGGIGLGRIVRSLVVPHGIRSP
jgi:signal transduction histidine kinase